MIVGENEHDSRRTAKLQRSITAAYRGFPFNNHKGNSMHPVSTSNLERVLNNAEDTAVTQAAIDELNRLRELNHYLLTHLAAVKRQTDASLAGVLSLVGEVESHRSAHLLGCLSE